MNVRAEVEVVAFRVTLESAWLELTPDTDGTQAVPEGVLVQVAPPEEPEGVEVVLGVLDGS